jgi:tetratricopeptide (TPR) repeat protein
MKFLRVSLRSASLRVCLLPLLMLLCSHQVRMGAQTGTGALDPKVQQLYTEARAAAASGELAAAISKYEAMLKIAPRLGPAYNNLGMLYYEQHNLPKATAVLEQGLKVDPGMASASALLGSAYFEMGEFAKARPHLELTLRLNAKDAHARTILARDLINLQQYQEAAVQLHTLITDDPRNQEAWYLLGKVYLQLSEAALSKVHEIDPNSVLSHEISGEIMQSMNNVDGALGEYKKAVQMAPDQPGTHEHLADAFWAIGKWDSAQAEYQAELANDPANCNARWKMANSLLEQNGPPEQVLAGVNAALAQCPDLVGARVDRARALVKAGRPSEALPDLFAAEKSHPDDTAVHFLLASVYRSQGRAADANTEMQIYSRLQQSASDAVAKHAVEIESIKDNAH